MSARKDKYAAFVEHPRYGRRPNVTGLNPADNNYSIDPATGYYRVSLGWRGPKIANTAIRADLTRQTPATIPITHYFDLERTCRDCGRPFIFFAAGTLALTTRGQPCSRTSRNVRCMPHTRRSGAWIAEIITG